MLMPNAANPTDESEQTDDVAGTSRLSPLHRAEGVTVSERYLNKLCDRSFLTLWSYPGIFRNQKINNGTSEGKELCDVLVVFENHVIIFSDKDCEFPNTGDLQTDWRRWYQKSVKKSADQIFGAERWLKTNPDKVFLDRACTQAFPYPFPAPDVAQYHRIAVARGCAKRCQRYFNPMAPWAGSGSLMLDSKVRGNDHVMAFEDGGRPFVVGQVDPSRGFVHVFDETTLDIVLGQLDTVSDFVAYLMKKEHLFTMTSVSASGEEELLGYYLGNTNKQGEHEFDLSRKYDYAAYLEGTWAYFLQSPERAAKIAADENSYQWDAIIERTSARARNGESKLSYADSEMLLRYFAREPRLRRRELIRSILDLAEQAHRAKLTKPNLTPRGLVMPLHPDDPYFVFLIVPVFDFLLTRPDYESEYEEARAGLLTSLCMVVKAMHPEAKSVIGYATGLGHQPCETSEHLVYFDTTTWTDEYQREGELLRNELGLFINPIPRRRRIVEYPVRRPLVPMALPKKNKTKSRRR